MAQDTIIIAAAIFGGVYLLATIAYLMFRQYMRLREKELQVEHARLDDFRAHLERQLMELNVKFASSEGRWRELNHLVVAGQTERKGSLDSGTTVAPSEFLRSHGITERQLEVRPDLIFVLTPFHDDFRDDFQTVAQVGQELGFTVNRGDERVSQGDIFSQLLRLLVTAKVVVANISGRNPNVFYELGIAHALDKPVILLAHNQTDVPFDIRSKRIVFYQSSEELRDRLSKMLTRTLVARDA
jgi:hypothetical protein